MSELSDLPTSFSYDRLEFVRVKATKDRLCSALDCKHHIKEGEVCYQVYDPELNWTGVICVSCAQYWYRRCLDARDKNS